MLNELNIIYWFAVVQIRIALAMEEQQNSCKHYKYIYLFGDEKLGPNHISYFAIFLRRKYCGV